MNKETKDLIEFEIKSNDAGKIEAHLNVSPQLPSFAGHFPGRPILPAVSVIDISLYLLDCCGFPTIHDKIAIKRSKFIGMILPNQAIDIFAEERNDNQWSVVWYAAKDKARLAVVNLERIQS